MSCKDNRFSQYRKLAAASKADFAFVQHIIHHLDENGIMAETDRLIRVFC
jgi:type I restriction enzyme M protein